MKLNGSNSVYVPWTFNDNPKKCPCYGCEERHASCHGSCQKYKEWQEARPKKVNPYGK